MRLCMVLLLAFSAGAALAAPPARVVALHPLELPEDLEDPAPVRALFDSLLTVQLKAAGPEVIPSRESGATWKRLVHSVEGFYDAFTGDTVVSEYAAVHHGTLRDLAGRFGAELWLRPRLEVVTVDWERGKARWDGAEEGVAPVGGGRVPALSLVIAVEDTSGLVVASGRGGLQVLGKWKGQRFQEVPREKLFADRKRNATAVALALAPLLEGRKP